VPIARPAGVTAPSGYGDSSTLTTDSSLGFDSAAPDASLSAGASDGVSRGLASGRWLGWRRRALMVLALLGCVGLFALLRYLAGTHYIDVNWRVSSTGQIELLSSGDAQLRQRAGQYLRGLETADGHMLPAQTLASRPSPRWIVDDEERAQQIVLEAQLAAAMEQPSVRLHFDGVAPIDIKPVPRGYAGLGAPFWLLTALALVLYLIGAVVVLVRPDERNLLYGLIALCQTTNLLLIALESLQGFGLPLGIGEVNSLVRLGCDVITGAAILHAISVHPRQVPHRKVIAGFGWALALAFVGAAALGGASNLWWWTQVLLLTYGIVCTAVLTWSYRLLPHPFSIVLRRIGLLLAGTLGLLTIAIGLAGREPGVQQTIASIGPVIWYVFFASAVMLIPFLSRSQQVMREFTLLAGVSTVATSLDLLFVAVFALGQFTSLTLALFVALGVYAGTRQWILNQLMGSNMLTTERMFESLYRAAREIESAGSSGAEHLSKLLGELFEPLEVTHSPRTVPASRVVGDGSTLMVPVPQLPGIDTGAAPRGSLVLRFARRGRRLFTREDARLTDRVLDQLARAIAFDRAVEQGRNEERARIAQDLHDDIGARLLTLMYKAQSPEMEDYVRHTLQDLKTLTRGLAASSHRLSHASAEWKADISQRLHAAHCELHWSFDIEREVNLSVVQWSALTRMLRELINNVIVHANASRVDVTGRYERGRFTLTVGDDGVGRDPQGWSHGLGLGGIRKRVKLLGGEVRWRDNVPRGVVCEIRVPELVERQER
jgi:signal transduction histidine kinase